MVIVRKLHTANLLIQDYYYYIYKLTVCMLLHLTYILNHRIYILSRYIIIYFHLNNILVIVVFRYSRVFKDIIAFVKFNHLVSLTI